MPTRQSRCLVALVAVLFGGCVASRPVDQSIFAVLPGTWAWEQNAEFGCEGNSHAISFTRDRKVMLLKYRQESKEQEIPADAVRYQVLQSEPHLRMVIEGEKRTTPAGDPVVWDVVLLGPDRFCWHRTDWQPGACTPAVVRCPVTNGATSLPPNTSLERTRER
jgi:hypothetical protein